MTTVHRVTIRSRRPPWRLIATYRAPTYEHAVDWVIAAWVPIQRKAVKLTCREVDAKHDLPRTITEWYEASCDQA